MDMLTYEDSAVLAAIREYVAATVHEYSEVDQDETDERHEDEEN
jgi:hypothetical protein